MDSRLLKHLTDADKRAQFTEEFKHSILREKLEEIIQGKIDSVRTSSVEDYTVPSWPYFKADQVGYERALTEMLNILKK